MEEEEKEEENVNCKTIRSSVKTGLFFVQSSKIKQVLCDKDHSLLQSISDEAGNKACKIVFK